MEQQRDGGQLDMRNSRGTTTSALLVSAILLSGCGTSDPVPLKGEGAPSDRRVDENPQISKVCLNGAALAAPITLAQLSTWTAAGTQVYLCTDYGEAAISESALPGDGPWADATLVDLYDPQGPRVDGCFAEPASPSSLYLTDGTTVWTTARIVCDLNDVEPDPE